MVSLLFRDSFPYKSRTVATQYFATTYFLLSLQFFQLFLLFINFHSASKIIFKFHLSIFRWIDLTRFFVFTVKIIILVHISLHFNDIYFCMFLIAGWFLAMRKWSLFFFVSTLLDINWLTSTWLHATLWVSLDSMVHKFLPLALDFIFLLKIWGTTWIGFDKHFLYFSFEVWECFRSKSRNFIIFFQYFLYISLPISFHRHLLIQAFTILTLISDTLGPYFCCLFYPILSV